MITQLTIRNFKQFEEVTIPLCSPVVFVGPNNSGKTTALQALALWSLGVRTWQEKRGEKSNARLRTSAMINRHDLVLLPIPNTALLWRDKRLRQAPNGSGKATQNILIEVEVQGITRGKQWRCPMKFDYANEEIIHCRFRIHDERSLRFTVPAEAAEIQVSFLPPMSGLASTERRIDDGAIEVSLGEGQTAQVLRNLCWKLWDVEREKTGAGEWGSLVEQMQRLFGVAINPPEYIASRGEIQMSYRERIPGGMRKELDIASAGRGFHQTLLILSFLRWRPNSVLLIDEPDAHLENLRQRQIYAELTETSNRLGGQLIIATHSEVVMNEADSSALIAFVGKPHPLKHSDQVRKALALLGYEQFLQAESTGWVLYLEGSTDLKSLKMLASIALPSAIEALENSFTQYVFNQPDKARNHFYGLREAYPDLQGIAIFDNSPGVNIHTDSPLIELKWQRRELENYFCRPFLLRRWVKHRSSQDDLFTAIEVKREMDAMEEAIRENTIPVALDNPSHPFWINSKSSDDYLPAIFHAFFSRLGLPNCVNKSDFAELAGLLEPAEVDLEIVGVLSAIERVYTTAKVQREAANA